MERIEAFVPLTFFGELLPFNMKSGKGNAMIMQAHAADLGDSTDLQSREFLLFTNGMATIVLRAKALIQKGVIGYVMHFAKKSDERGVTYWEVRAARDQNTVPPWQLRVSYVVPDSDDEGHIKMLVQKKGDPGQFLFLARPAY